MALTASITYLQTTSPKEAGCVLVFHARNTVLGDGRRDQHVVEWQIHGPEGWHQTVTDYAVVRANAVFGGERESDVHLHDADSYPIKGWVCAVYATVAGDYEVKCRVTDAKGNTDEASQEETVDADSRTVVDVSTTAELQAAWGSNRRIRLADGNYPFTARWSPSTAANVIIEPQPVATPVIPVIQCDFDQSHEMWRFNNNTENLTIRNLSFEPLHAPAGNGITFRAGNNAVVDCEFKGDYDGDRFRSIFLTDATNSSWTPQGLLFMRNKATNMDGYAIIAMGSTPTESDSGDVLFIGNDFQTSVTESIYRFNGSFIGVGLNYDRALEMAPGSTSGKSCARFQNGSFGYAYHVDGSGNFHTGAVSNLGAWSGCRIDSCWTRGVFSSTGQSPALTINNDSTDVSIINNLIRIPDGPVTGGLFTVNPVDINGITIAFNSFIGLHTNRMITIDDASGTPIDLTVYGNLAQCDPDEPVRFTNIPGSVGTSGLAWDQNMWPETTQVTTPFTAAGSNMDLAAWNALSYIGTDLQEDVTLGSNGAPQTSTTVKRRDGVLRDFYGAARSERTKPGAIES